MHNSMHKYSLYIYIYIYMYAYMRNPRETGSFQSHRGPKRPGHVSHGAQYDCSHTPLTQIKDNLRIPLNQASFGGGGCLAWVVLGSMSFCSCLHLESWVYFGMGTCITVGSRKLEHGFRMTSAGIPSFCSLRLKDGHVPTFWLLLQALLK